jgi:hypothetical protein
LGGLLLHLLYYASPQKQKLLLRSLLNSLAAKRPEAATKLRLAREGLRCF